MTQRGGRRVPGAILQWPSRWPRSETASETFQPEESATRLLRPSINHEAKGNPPSPGLHPPKENTARGRTGRQAEPPRRQPPHGRDGARDAQPRCHGLEFALRCNLFLIFSQIPTRPGSPESLYSDLVTINTRGQGKIDKRPILLRGGQWRARLGLIDPVEAFL